MNLVIEHLKKELERQNLLIAASEINKPLRDESPEFRASNPAIETVYPKIYQFRDELECAIAILKAI